MASSILFIGFGTSSILKQSNTPKKVFWGQVTV